MLDERWRRETRQMIHLDRTFLHVSISEFLAIDNQRMIPQQAVSTVTNVDDIESYIQGVGSTANKDPYLTAIDLPLSERDEAIKDLAFMGVTAGSLLPALTELAKNSGKEIFIRPQRDTSLRQKVLAENTLFLEGSARHPPKSQARGP